jgi:hypothetical protein
MREKIKHIKQRGVIKNTKTSGDDFSISYFCARNGGIENSLRISEPTTIK